jgi:hypothetical protein
MISKIVLMCLTILLSGCAASSIVVGKVRPAIPPEQVKLYLQPPNKFEEIAVLESSNIGSPAITSQGKTDVVIERLKEAAAKLGANGILLQGVGDRSAGSVSTGSTIGTTVTTPSYGSRTGGTATTYGSTTGTSFGVLLKVGNGVAIYVENQ